MTGEVTLRGKVLEIGGLKEKLMAAHRHGILEAIMPRDNEKDLPDIPDAIKKTMKLHFVDSMDQVLKIALEREIIPMVTDHRARELTALVEEDGASRAVGDFALLESAHQVQLRDRSWPSDAWARYS